MKNTARTESVGLPETQALSDPPETTPDPAGDGRRGEQTGKGGWERLAPPDWETVDRTAEVHGAASSESPDALSKGSAAGVVAAALLAIALATAFFSPAGEPLLRFLAKAATFSAKVSFPV